MTDSDTRAKAEIWCRTHISPQTFYTHIELGGRGWRINRKQKYIELADPADMIVLRLTLGI